MNRRNFFKMFGGAIAAAMLPLGALALIEQKPKRAEGFVDVTFTSGMMLGEFERLILEPAMQRMAQQLDTEMMRLYERTN